MKLQIISVSIQKGDKEKTMENESFNDLFRSASPEERLKILRIEMSIPIEIIRGYTALIKKQANSMDNQELIGFVEKIEQAAERLKMLRDAIS